MKTPNVSAWDHLMHACKYLKGHADYVMSAPLHSTVPAAAIATSNPYAVLSGDGATDDSHGWTFFCDSDHAGNSEPNNHRRSQNGYIALLNGAPVLVTSKAPSVAYANAIIGEAHADTSSAAVEIYAAGNATQESRSTTSITLFRGDECSFSKADHASDGQ